MDPWRILGVAPGAARVEVREAYRRLSRRVAPDAGGSRGLEELVTDAYRAAIGSPPAGGLDIDPFHVLGVSVGASKDETRAAYRRLARLVHPDRGGTDELFHVIDTAYDLLTDPLARIPRRERRRYQPPPPPPPPGPFRPRPPDIRRFEPAWRSWLTVAGSASILVAGLGIVVFTAFAIVGATDMPFNPWPLFLFFAAGIGLSARTAVQSMLRAVVRLRARQALASVADLDAFLEARCLDAPVGREREDVLYLAYRRWCSERARRAVSPWVFLEYLRSLGLLYVNTSSWETGVLVGIRLRD